MKYSILKFFIICLVSSHLQSEITHFNVNPPQEWEQENLEPFDELLLSWNGSRPEKGKFLFQVSVKTDRWSSWLPYASWGSEGQSSFDSADKESFVTIYQDTLDVTEGKKATAFRVKIIAEEGASLIDLQSLHVYTNGDKKEKKETSNDNLPSTNLKVAGLSQIILKDPRCWDLCSPTSTTVVTRYLSENQEIDPLFFAKNVLDAGFDIYGNWVFNVAEASTHLGSKWDVWVERLHGFHHLSSHLLQGNPVIVSVVGDLPGGAISYDLGHLMTVIGYDASDHKVLCLDSAFPSDKETHVRYDLTDFLAAWGRRGNVAYIFSKKI